MRGISGRTSGRSRHFKGDPSALLAKKKTWDFFVCGQQHSEKNSKLQKYFFFTCLHPKKKKKEKRTHVDDLHILELEIFLHQLYEAAGEDSVKCHQRRSKMKAKKKDPK
jgi:hypothetical protein